uniref:Uncharacterized protein n=1 Tax=Timema shepardi TaxID=629360 RepID=A0A7R9ASB3_TIMSH|nr:unnamed protein product [Timema shepardi]
MMSFFCRPPEAHGRTCALAQCVSLFDSFFSTASRKKAEVIPVNEEPTNSRSRRKAAQPNLGEHRTALFNNDLERLLEREVNGV